MSGIVEKALIMGKKAWLYVLQYLYIVMHWMIRFFKILLQNVKKRSAQKSVDKAYTGLGAEMYSFYKQGGEAGWKNVPSIEQQLMRVETAEAQVFGIDGVIEQIDRDYQSKREELRSTYAARRSALDSSHMGYNP